MRLCKSRRQKQETQKQYNQKREKKIEQKNEQYTKKQKIHIKNNKTSKSVKPKHQTTQNPHRSYQIKISTWIPFKSPRTHILQGNK